MIRFIRSVRAQPGKEAEALQVAKEVADHLGRGYGAELRVFMEVFGDVGTVFWMGDFEDVATLERLAEQTAQDQEYRAILKRGNELSVGGTLRDRVLRHV